MLELGGKAHTETMLIKELKTQAKERNQILPTEGWGNQGRIMGGRGIGLGFCRLHRINLISTQALLCSQVYDSVPFTCFLPKYK